MTSTRYKQIQRTTTERQCDHKDTQITTDNHKAQSSRAKRETTFTQRQATTKDHKGDNQLQRHKTRQQRHKTTRNNKHIGGQKQPQRHTK